jgi:hypothetical protein
MNSYQYRKHFELMENDQLVKDLLQQIKNSKDSDLRADLTYKIYDRSNELKEQVKSMPTATIKHSNTVFDMSHFCAGIDAYFARAVL